MAQRGHEKMAHQGTFNANPVSAAAGTAALTIIAESDACDRASATAASLRAAWNEVLAEPSMCPGRSTAPLPASTCSSIRTAARCDPRRFDASACGIEELKTQPKQLLNRLRLALLVNGVDVGGRIGGFLSCTHTDDDVARDRRGAARVDPHAAPGGRTAALIERETRRASEEHRDSRPQEKIPLRAGE